MNELKLQIAAGEDFVELPAALALTDLPLEAIGTLFLIASLACDLPEGGHQQAFDRMQEVSPEVLKILGDRKIITATQGPDGKGIGLHVDLGPLGL